MLDSKATPEAVETSTITTIATLDVRDASAHGLALMSERVENQKKMLAIAIKLTSPNQWVIFAGNGKESVYPTGGAADTILRRAFGLTWDVKEMTVEETPDGRLATCTAWLMRGDVRVEQFTGYRFMGGFVKDEASLRKGAIENLKSVAVRDLLGLRFRTPDELKEMGLDMSKLDRRVEFQTHDKDPGTMKVPFGRDKGKPIVDIDDVALKWLAEAVKKSVDDPEKAKFKARNEALLTDLRDEYKRRHAPAEGHDPKTGEVKKDKTDEKSPGEDPFNYGPPPMGEEFGSEE